MMNEQQIKNVKVFVALTKAKSYMTEGGLADVTGFETKEIKKCLKQLEQSELVEKFDKMRGTAIWDITDKGVAQFDELSALFKK